MKPAEVFRIRTHLGLTQIEFASLMEVSPGTISHWERGTCIPRRANHQKLTSVKQKVEENDLLELAEVYELDEEDFRAAFSAAAFVCRKRGLPIKQLCTLSTE